jgi:glucose/mannose-6-phosphate isomerase
MRISACDPGHIDRPGAFLYSGRVTAHDSLDDGATVARLDPRGMLATVAALPTQVRAAHALGHAVDLPDTLHGADAIVVLGVGGSAIAGDLLQGLLAERLAVPFMVVRGEEVPAFVGPRTLVVASSYSGNTQETLAAVAEARRRGARLLAVTTGGTLGTEAGAGKLPVVTLPAGYLPRAALAFSLVPLLTVLARLGYTAPVDVEIEQAAHVLEVGNARLAPGAPGAANLAKQVARALHGRLAVVYGSGGLGGAVACRWKGQLNENAKHVAHHAVFPELGHNEVESWRFPRELEGSAHLVVLHDTAETAATRRRVEVVTGLMQPWISGVTAVTAAGTAPLARCLSLVQVGDFASCYLALLNGADPSAMPNIERLKAGLSSPG